MSELYIDKLIITDFGPFFDRHEFDFTGTPDKPVILVGGRNGAGKTHLLRAIYLAIAGEVGVGDLRYIESAESGNTGFKVEESLNRLAKAKGRDKSKLSITLRIRDKTDSIGRKVIFIREIRHRPNSPPIFIDKMMKIDPPEEYSSEKSEEHKGEIGRTRDDFLPRHLARFFFFDAERGQSVQLSNADITEGISRILGLFSYGQLAEELRKLPIKRSGIKEASALGDKLNEIQMKIRQKHDYLKGLIADSEKKQQNLLELKGQLSEIETELQSLGAIDPKEERELKDKEKKLSVEREKLLSELRQAWEKEIPIMLLGKYRQELYDYLCSEERRREWENRKFAVEPRIPQVTKDVFDNIPAEHQLQEVTLIFYEKRLQEALRRIFDPAPQGISKDIFAIPDSNERSRDVRILLKTSTGKLSKLCRDYDHKSSEHGEIERKVRRLEKDEGTKKRIEDLWLKKGEIGSQIRQIEKDVELLEGEKTGSENLIPELKREESNLERELEKFDKEKSISELASRYRTAAEEIGKRAAIRLRDKISSIVGELWLDITERGMEFQSLEFSEKWTCSLVRFNGEKLSWDSINASAGQKQVRVLAFTEALRRLAHKIPPLVVDTPMGRLDKEVKQNVLERLYLKGHQSIIFSTDAEIDPEGALFKQIAGRVARVYTLNAEGDPESRNYHVRVSHDYFKRVL
jgi:DNA sulfur modification protein DndD